MQNSNSSVESIFLVDDLSLHEALIYSLQSTVRPRARLTPATGAGFASGVQFQLKNHIVHILCLGDHTSHPFSYLTLGAFATQREISSVIALTTAHSLREDLFPGDLAIVRRASALPYPALFANKDPYEQNPPEAEHFEAKPETLDHFTKQVVKQAKPILWQREVPQVRCGYAKHPTWGGELMPWAPQQFDNMRQQGIDTISSAAVGVYEAQKLMPDARIICINQVVSNPNADSTEQWKRFKFRFQIPVAKLLSQIISEDGME